ncbi:DUF86 domain-containing protein [Chengkuizengella sediminis]|uniref:DUF86 domain-containing protein n=1 Tax=Chengkuizengella sediminis TaxID=1885917 RepID=UPI001389D433|nr:HepT-like ribonuclease domain-containing protein [Chengkuizengella sediminis]NDI34142.1 DUF86 domain-containing protein [Chengkuizengella sediminis]
MYYVNQDQINQRLEFMDWLVGTIPESLENKLESESVIQFLAQERILHLALESVTDIGSYLIDGFLMRDASSYEDIIEILHGEKVFPSHLLEPLLNLVKMRKKLVQEYFHLDRNDVHPLLFELPNVLSEFSISILNYLKHELNT